MYYIHTQQQEYYHFKIGGYCCTIQVYSTCKAEILYPHFIFVADYVITHNSSSVIEFLRENEKMLRNLLPERGTGGAANFKYEN